MKQFPSLQSQLSQGGYTSEAAELDCDKFDHTTLTKSFSKPTHFDIGMNVGTNELAAAFPSLNTPINPLKYPSHEN